MDIVITGANSAVGQELIQFYSQNAENVHSRIRALVRDLKKAEPLRPLAAELMEVNYQKPETLKEGLEGAEAVVHLAGALKPRKGETLQEANVTTTKVVVEAALRAGIKCFVYISHPGASLDSKNPYFHTKGAAEKIIQEAGFGGTIFQIPMILGPGNGALDALVRMAQAPITPLIGSGSVLVQPVSQVDVARAIDWALHACSQPLTTIPLYGAETLTYSNLLQLVAQRLGKRPKTIPIPKSAAKLAIWVASGFSTSAASNYHVVDTVFDEYVTSEEDSENPLPISLELIHEMLDHAFPPQHSI